MRAELEALRKAQATAYRTDAAAAKGEHQAQDDGDAKDREYQAMLEDLEAQTAELRRLAKEVVDPSFLNAAIENLESRAAAVRTERRATWSVPRLLDRHRARVAERAARVDKAKEKVAELESELAKVQTELVEAKAHLVAKQEDLDSESAEVARLEAQLPNNPARPTGQASGAARPPVIDLEAPEAEQTILDSLRHLAASKGGAWQKMLAVIPVVETPEDPKPQNEDKDAKMEDAPQNAKVSKPEALVASPSSGSSLAAVPRLGGNRAPLPLEGNKAKQQRV